MSPAFLFTSGLAAAGYRPDFFHRNPPFQKSNIQKVYLTLILLFWIKLSVMYLTLWKGLKFSWKRTLETNAGLLLPSHFIQLFRGRSEVFPGQPTDIASPTRPAPSLRPEADFCSFLCHRTLRESSKLIMIVYLGPQ